MKRNILTSLYILFLFPCIVIGQKAKVVQANKNYDKFAYIDAIKTYERVAEKGYKSEELFQKLGNASYYNSQYEKSAKWYGELYSMNPNLDSEYLYKYYQSLKAIGEYKKAESILEEFNKKASNDSRVAKSKEPSNSTESIKAKTGKYTNIENVGFNSKYSDYGPSFYMDKLIFASSRDTGNLGQRKHSWTNDYFTDLYQVNLNGDKTYTTPVKFAPNLNSKFHESTAVFTKDGKTMYFTRNNYTNGKKGKSDNKITLIKIYKSTLVDNKWTEATELPFNSNNYSTAHPALSNDEKTLYFASDMPGTIGQSDLFKVAINPNGTYGAPINLGPEINTKGRETFPFVSSDNELFFASDGHPGLGGLDIFSSKITPEGKFEAVQNIGSEINSPKDDFAYIIDTKTNKGFFSSNRENGIGSDDIYSFTKLPEVKEKPKQESIISVKDSKTQEPVSDVKISIYDDQFKLIETAKTDINGNFITKTDPDKTYTIRAEKEGYNTTETKVQKGIKSINIPFEKTICKVGVGDDVAKCFGIKNIYFDLNKSIITDKAVLDLEKILDVLNNNPTVKINIRSHTDSRGSYEYNKILSEKRAKSTIAWLVKKGINPNRLSGKGYGEKNLINNCSDGVPCSEEEHQQNRRSEFIITYL